MVQPIQIFIADEAQMTALGQMLARMLMVGDVVRLHGELGAGKSTLARAMIRALGRVEGTIPSPTFTLVQTYEETTPPVAHVDAYRLTDAEELAMLGLDEWLQDGVILIEWPPEEFLHQNDEAGTLDIHLSYGVEDGREVRMMPFGRFTVAMLPVEV